MIEKEAGAAPSTEATSGTCLRTGASRLDHFQEHKNISCQLVDDIKGVTLASASTLEGCARLLEGGCNLKSSKRCWKIA